MITISGFPQLGSSSKLLYLTVAGGNRRIFQVQLIRNGGVIVNVAVCYCLDIFNFQAGGLTSNTVNHGAWKKYIKALYIPYWGKIAFKGKGFRIKRSYKKFSFLKIKFIVGYSYNLIWRGVYNRWAICRLRRQRYLFWTFNRIDFYRVCTQIRQIKVVNKYTLRGLRIRKQYLSRRFGKISQVISAHNR